MSLEASGNTSEDLTEVFLALHSLAAFQGDDDDEDLDDEDNTGEGGEQEEQDAEDKSKDVRDPDAKARSEEAKRYRLRARDERRQREEAEAKLRELESKDKSEAERLRSDLEAVTAERDELKERFQPLAREVALARASVGRNVEDLDLLGYFLDKEKVEYLDDDGEIVDISDEVEALLKRKPNLVAASGSDGKGKDEDADEPSGRATNGKKARKGDTDYEALKQKFPALRR